MTDVKISFLPKLYLQQGDNNLLHTLPGCLSFHLYFASFPQKKKALNSSQVGDDSRDPLAEPQWVFPQSIDSVKSIKKKQNKKKPPGWFRVKQGNIRQTLTAAAVN